MWYDDPVIVTAVVVVVIVSLGAVIFTMRRFGGKPVTPKTKPKLPTDANQQYGGDVPFKVTKSIQANTASNAKDELRTLDLEREILGDAIRRLYEAHAEGKITEAEREQIASTYKMRMNNIKESISKDENIIALHELEDMREDLMKLFSERFTDLTSKVDELRTRIDVKPIKEVPIKVPTTPVQIESDEDEEEEEEEKETGAAEEKPKKKRKPLEEKQPEPKTEAERRIESIRSEVEKVLDRLGQMEVEG